MHELTFVHLESLLKIIEVVKYRHQDFFAELFELVLECFIESKVRNELGNLGLDLGLRVWEVNDSKPGHCRRTDVGQIVGLEEHLHVLHVVDAVAVGQGQHLAVVEHCVHGLEPHGVNRPVHHYPLVDEPVDFLQVPRDGVRVDEGQLLALLALHVPEHAFPPLFAYVGAVELFDRECFRVDFLDVDQSFGSYTFLDFVEVGPEHLDA